MAQQTYYSDLEIRIFERINQDYPVEFTLGREQVFKRGFLSGDSLPQVQGASPIQDGRRLFDWLVADQAVQEAWTEARGKGRMRRIRLRIDDPAGSLHAIPWELMQDTGDEANPPPLAATAETPFSRYRPGKFDAPDPITGRPIKILVAIANPDNLADFKLAPIDEALEWALLKTALDEAKQVELTQLPQPCTLAALEDELKRGYHILHFIGHGFYSRRQNLAQLYMADAENQVALVSAAEFAALMQRLRHGPTTSDGGLQLIFLASCQTATVSPGEAFLGFAPTLVDAGVPAVLAMQDRVSLNTAQTFAQSFYTRLLDHGQVDLACNEARSRLIGQTNNEWAVPVLYMRQRHGHLFKRPEDAVIATDKFISVNGEQGSKLHARENDRQRSAPKQRPPYTLPRRIPKQLLDRRQELSEAVQTINAGQFVELCGPHGVGKTTLLHHIAGNISAASFPDGVITFPAEYENLHELGQHLLDQFEESDDIARPGVIQRKLRARKALILMDNADTMTVGSEQLETFLDQYTPNCTFLISSQSGSSLSGRLFNLPGLPQNEALDLLEKQLNLGRALTETERADAETICRAVQGHPGNIIQQTQRVVSKQCSLHELAQELQADASEEHLGATLMAPLSEDERQVAGLLAALDTVTITLEHLSAITDLSDPAPILRALFSRRLLAVEGEHMTLVGPLKTYLQQNTNLTPWLERSLTHFLAWAERHAASPDALRPEIKTFRYLVRWAARMRRWAALLRLVRLFENTLIQSKHWGLWEQALNLAREAAQALSNQAAESWAVHQLGTRALCLDNTGLARDLLIRALHMRETIGDRLGAEVTRHNLQFLFPPPVDTGQENGTNVQPPVEPSPLARWWAAIPAALKGALAIVLLSLIIVGLILIVPPPEPTPTPTSSPPPTAAAQIPPPTSTASSAFILFPAELRFAPQTVNTDSQPQSVTVYNNFATALQVQAITIDGDGSTAFLLAADGCANVRLIPGQNCEISLRFRPLAEGQQRANLFIFGDVSGYSAPVPLFGSGIVNTPTPTPTATPTSTSTATSSPTPTRTISPTPTFTPTPTPTTPAPLPAISFSQQRYSVNENQSPASLAVQLSAPSDQTITVNYESRDGTANAGSDYTAVSGTLTFSPGAQTRPIDVPILNDDLIESDETVFLQLSGAVNATLGLSAATLDIVDDETRPSVRLAQPAIAVISETDTTVYAFDLFLSAPSNQVVTVDYGLSGTAGSADYIVFTASPVRFQPGETTTSIQFQVVNDVQDEPDETIVLTLTNAQNADIVGGPATVQIADDDPLPYIFFRSWPMSVLEGDGPAVVEVILTAPSSQIVTVDYATQADQSVVPGVDYLPASGTLTFNPGETVKQFTVDILDDSNIESSVIATVEIVLSNLQNARPAQANLLQTDLYIVDNDVYPQQAVASPVVGLQNSLFYIVEEHEGQVSIDFHLLITQTLTLSFVTDSSQLPENAATPGEDYQPVDRNLIFPPGDTKQTAMVNILPDDTAQEFEFFRILLQGSSSRGIAIGGGPITVIIFDYGAQLPESAAGSALSK